MQAVLIRPAQEEDIATLINLYIEFHEFHVHGVPDRLRIPEDYELPELRKSLKKIIEDENAVILLAITGDDTVGIAEIYLREDTPDPAIVPHRYGYLQSLAVTEPWRMHGVGAQLIAATEQWASERGATEIQLETWEFDAGPLHFYEKQRYRTLKRKMVKEL